MLSSVGISSLVALIGSRAGRYAIAGLAIAAVLGVAYWRITDAAYDRGWEAALTAVAEQDERARDAAEDVRDDVDECFSNAGDWDVSDGTCNYPDE